MKAARLHNYNEYLHIDEVDEPEATGPLDVIVMIGASGLCRTDLHLKDGDFKEIHEAEGVELPYTLGHESAGWVHEVGSAVTNVEVGDAVVVHPLITCGLCRACRAGDDMHCVEGVFPGLFVDGGHADFLKTHARSVIKLPDGVQPKDIAAHADAGLTAYHAVKKAADILYPGTRVVVIGAGGLGHIAVQCLKALTPAEVVVVDRLEPALELARDIVAEQGVEKVAPQMVRDAGTYYVVGYGGALDIPTQEIILREISIVGNLVGTYNDLAELMTLAGQGKVTLHTSEYPLDAINDAMVDLENGDLRGRGILIPEGASA